MHDIRIRWNRANAEPVGPGRDFEAMLGYMCLDYQEHLGVGRTEHQDPPNTTYDRITALVDQLAERNRQGGGRLRVVKEQVSGTWGV